MGCADQNILSSSPWYEAAPPLEVLEVLEVCVVRFPEPALLPQSLYLYPTGVSCAGSSSGWEPWDTSLHHSSQRCFWHHC